MSDHFNLSLKRADLVKVLQDMNVSVPVNSTLSDAKLEKRLKQALNALQMAHRLLTHPTINFDALETQPSEYKLFPNIARSAVGEGFAPDAGQKDTLYKNVFTDLRQTYMSIGNAFDQGIRSVIVQDLRRERFAVMIRILNVYQLDEKTPLIKVVCSTADRSDSQRAAEWLARQPSSPDNRRQLADISATDAELKLLSRILNLNSKRVSEECKVPMDAWEVGFKASFLLPIGPLDYKDLAKLNYDFGCPMCGENATKRCSQCQSVSYCSAECQKADWPQHRPSCRDLKGGTWLALPFHTRMSYAQDGGVTALINHRATRTQDITIQRGGEHGDAPPNAHDDKPFLVKIQISMDGGMFLIYDRQRSMQVYAYGVDPADGRPEWYRKVLDEMKGPRAAFGGIKMYRWARRSGDFELNVCLDRSPKEQIAW